MASETGIISGACLKLGTNPITSRLDPSKAGRVFDAIYDGVRDAELRKNWWRFSIARTELSALAEVPIGSQYSHIYQLPTDCLMVIQVSEFFSTSLTDYRGASEAPYAIEGRKLLTTFPAPLFLRYIKRIIDTGLMDVAFQACLSSRLAYEASEAITGSTSKGQAALTDYQLALSEAQQANAIETPPDVLPDDSWIVCRL